MNIREATLDDIVQIMHIEKVSFAPEICEKENVFVERVQTCTNCFVVFEDDSKVVGYFCAERWKSLPCSVESFALGHSANSHVEDGSVLYLSSFAILPELRGKGCGKKLFAKSLEWFTACNRGIKMFALLVNENWHSATSIYKSYGFAVERVFDNFFVNQDGSKSAGVVMIKVCHAEPCNEHTRSVVSASM